MFHGKRLRWLVAKISERLGTTNRILTGNFFHLELKISGFSIATGILKYFLSENNLPQARDTYFLERFLVLDFEARSFLAFLFEDLGAGVASSSSSSSSAPPPPSPSEASSSLATRPRGRFARAFTLALALAEAFGF